MNFWQTFFGVYKGQVCTFACTSIIDFRAFRMPDKTILQHNINQPGPLSDHPKRDIILPYKQYGDCISFDWSMRQTQESGIRRLVLVGCRSFSFPELYLFEMRLINYDDQRLRFLVILGNELLRLGQKVDLAGSGEVLHKVFGADTNPVVFHTRRKIVAR